MLRASRKGNPMSSDEYFGYRKIIRLPFYDYSSGGYYFVTLCSSGWETIFGRIENDDMVLSEFGQVVESAWYGIPLHFHNADIDAFVVMPNHFHGIIVIKEDEEINHRTRAQHDAMESMRHIEYQIEMLFV
jgi:REP-associated tyrosine transposase